MTSAGDIIPRYSGRWIDPMRQNELSRVRRVTQAIARIGPPSITACIGGPSNVTTATSLYVPIVSVRGWTISSVSGAQYRNLFRCSGLSGLVLYHLKTNVESIEPISDLVLDWPTSHE